MNRPLCEFLETRRLFVIDLMCLNVNVVSYDADTGILKYSTVITNTGTTPIPVDCHNKVFLSKDTEVNNPDDIAVDEYIPNNEIPSTGTLNTYTRETMVRLAAPGTYFLGVALDSDNTVTEPDNLNNYKFSTTKITVPDKYNIVVDGTDGADLIQASQSGDAVSVGMNGQSLWVIRADRVGSIHLRGGGGNDRIYALTMKLPITAEGGDGKDKIDGGEAADSLSGNAGPDIISGYGGNDRINGNGGNDQLYGQAGADRIYGYAGNDLLDGGSSNDRLDGGAGRDSLYGQGGDDRFYTKDATIDSLFGGTGSDTAISADIFDIKQSV